ncbi:hypothetical protein [Streptomyces sp. H27-H5]|uniref:hypothetical protein n=1 Tax=Streptomyces sp. H27-H5 TaxID=2996460 RepID=UPI00226FEA00|nr:hypothetical protein [Streptomyces sp. H27-H5]MCY0958265.1 hypothetical protein [Streptomyces sp. H27-H5]
MTSRMTWMAGVLLVAVLPALTACGTTKAGSAGNTTPTAAGSPDPVASGLARHDRLFPDVAARCAQKAAEASADPQDGGTNGGANDGASGGESSRELPMDPEARKYAENHAYKTQDTLSAESRCRADAHGARIKAALTGAGKAAPRGDAELAASLKELGYSVTGNEVYRSGGALGFSLFIPEAGPCVTGRWTAGGGLTVEGHGVYMEGGCLEPKGGH